MLRHRCRRLLARLEQGLQLLELGGSVEEDCIQIARCFEATRQRCCRLEQDGRRAREQLARVEAERAALEVKLKHARNQVEVEMKKRHRAEAELEKQERKLQLVFELLMREPWGNEVLSREQCSVLSALAGRHLGVTLALGRSGAGVVRGGLLSELEMSVAMSRALPVPRLPTAFQDVDTTVVRTLKRKAPERQHVSLAPQIGPVMMAKRHRSSVVPHSAVIRPEPCGVCGSRIRFGKTAIKCCQCQLLLHTKCREQCPSLCAPRSRHHNWPREGVLADFTPSTPPLVPALVVQCVTEVETRGLSETGLYRVPGTEQLVREWKRRLLRAGDVLPALSSVTDIHVVCGVLKDFLRGLKEPLVTFSLHPAFLRAADILDDAACDTALRHVVSKLPPANRDTLAFLMLHLLRVSRSPDCKMDVFNLSRVFGPTLVGHSSANPTPLAIMEDTPRQCKVVARLLSLPPDFWRGFVGKEQENLVPMPALGSEHEPFFHPIASPESKSGQLSPAGTCCLPSTLRSCVSTATRPL
ncbi:rac GTPase-activating protein 1-like protein [Willisornis vidua]|uniref:Rac GTPase-activating protein 1-like protein n=1 Tax=Willisornis vidua TaxID=1566151 RepID=A0ABQ9CM86_9PASS|nr:rac GTPase-activating protein 1-like protein [Willisornis vidua]